MKRFSIITAMFLLMGMLFGTQVMAQGRIDFRTNSAQQCANVSQDGFTATFSFSGIQATEMNTEKGVFSNITMDGTYPSGNVGEPALPAAHQLIAVPFGAKVASLEIKSFSTTTYSLADYGIKTVMPQQPSVRKDQKPEDVKFAYSEKAYAAKSMSQRPIAAFEMKGTMRGIQVGSLTINPVNYNPATNSIEVYNDIEIEVRYDNYDKTAAYNEFARTFSPYFASVYRTMFNWRDDVYDQHPDLWQCPVKMLVIANRMFEECMQEWIAWKTMKGFYMDVNYTDEIGTSASAIRSFIQSKYAEEAPTFVIIFGDKEQVANSATGNETSKVTDLQYMSVDNDDFPDIYHSRMCAQTVAQMENIISKTLMYERYEQPDPTYLSNVLLVAGWDSYWTSYDGAPTIQYAMEYYYNTEHGFNEINYFLGQPYNNPYASINTGVGFVNYTAHGGETGWSDPSLSVSDVNNFTNEGKPFLAMGNCCLAADWGYSSTCFGEAMIRANTRGAYAYIGSCPSTYWYEDYYFGVGATNVFGQMPTYEQTAYGVYDAIWNDDEFNCVSAIPFLGNLAVCYAHAGSYQGSVSDRYYWQAYHTLGDGSVMPFRVQPTENNVSHMAIFPIGMNTYEVSAEPGSYVAISKDGVLHGVGLVGESGTVNVEVEPVTSAGEVTICVTGLDKIPYIATIPAAALEGPYVSVDSYTPANAHVGDMTELSITFKNVGTAATGGHTIVNLSCDDPDLTIVTGTSSFENLAPEATVTVSGFSYQIAQGVADGTRFTINTLAECNGNSWEGKAIITAGEAVLEFVDFITPGGFVPGETLTVIANFKNAGHFRASNAIATIASESTYVTFEDDTYEAGTIDPSGEAQCVFNVTIAANCPESEVIPLLVALNADGGLIAEGAGSLRNSCNVIFDLSDSYGDGWNGASLTVSFSDGTPSQNMTIQNGQSSASYTIEISNGVHVSLNWTSGSWDSECSFVVRYEDGDEIYNCTSVHSGLLYEFDCNCGSGSSTQVDPVNDLTGEINGYNIILRWNMSVKDDMLFHVYRNGVEIGQTTEYTYTDEVSVPMVYTYCVVAELDGNFSAPACIQIEFTDVVEESIDQINIYPNPVNNTLFISGYEAEYSYAMYNGLGQMMANGTVRGSQQINVESMAKGVYFLRITTGTQVRVEKVVVK